MLGLGIGAVKHVIAVVKKIFLKDSDGKFLKDSDGKSLLAKEV